jgi:hypothetical protein
MQACAALQPILLRYSHPPATRITPDRTAAPYPTRPSPLPRSRLTRPQTPRTPRTPRIASSPDTPPVVTRSSVRRNAAAGSRPATKRTVSSVSPMARPLRSRATGATRSRSRSAATSRFGSGRPTGPVRSPTLALDAPRASAALAHRAPLRARKTGGGRRRVARHIVRLPLGCASILRGTQGYAGYSGYVACRWTLRAVADRSSVQASSLSIATFRHTKARPFPAQMWARRAQPQCRRGRGEPSPIADVGGVSPVPARMWQPLLTCD